MALVWRILTRQRLQHPAVWLPLVLLFVGIVTRTLIDKYVMTISGLCCVALAGLLVRLTSRVGSPSPRGAGAPDVSNTENESKSQPDGAGTRRVLQLSLIALWLTCGVHLVTESYWSSLRWRDPMQQVISELLNADDATLVTSHPSARYYAALSQGDDADAWLRAWQQHARPDTNNLLLPSAFVERLAQGAAPNKILTLQTSGFASLPDWDAALDLLQQHYVRVGETTYLEDPDAELKDRLDPTIHHARHRITVQQWRRRTDSAQN